jgi:hypothetical protein
MAEYNGVVTGSDGSDSEKGLIERYEKRQERMESSSFNFRDLWQECMDYIIPRKGNIIDLRAPGEKRGHELFDSTAIMSNTLLAGALHSMLSNPATRFFELIMVDPQYEDDEEVRRWLQDTGERMFQALNGSNFQTEIHEVYLDLGAIGTACLYVEENEKNIVHFSARNMAEIFIEENNLGIIDILHRKFKWKPRQIIQEFGEDVNPFVLDQWRKGCDDDWEIIHVVEPKEDYNESIDYHPYHSCYYIRDKKIKLSSKGYKEFPYAVPRWTKTSGEVYGRGPGMDMLPDIKMVNKMMEATLKGAQKMVDPPLMIQDDGVIGRPRLTPGGLTFVRPTSEVPIRPLIVDSRVDFGYQAVEDVRKRIRSGFYVDQLQLNEGPQMTATEVNQRTEEKLRLMGPVLGRQHFEFLRPVIEKVFAIMKRKNMFMPAPDQIKGKDFDIRYSSMIARAQRMSDGQNLMRALSVASPIVNIDPKTVDNVDTDAALKYVFDVYGVPWKLFREQRKVDDMRKARDAAQAKLAQEQSAQHQADIVSKVGPSVVQAQQAANQAE